MTIAMDQVLTARVGEFVARNHMTHVATDTHFMEASLAMAEQALARGDFPVGAVLVIDGKIAGKDSNRGFTEQTWISHAETALIVRNSALLREKATSGADIQLHATLEPCLMCLGVAVQHRVSKITYSCPDPVRGSAHLDASHFKQAYVSMWPEIKQGPLRHRSYTLMTEFLKCGDEEWKRRHLKLYAAMRATWK